MKYSIRVIIGIVFIVVLLCLPLQDIECSQSDGTCSIYSRSWLLRSRKLIKRFKVSNIKRYEIEEYCHKSRGGACHRAYGINIYMKSGERVHINHEAKSYKRAQEIYNNMISSDFILKGSHLKSIFNAY